MRTLGPRLLAGRVTASTRFPQNPSVSRIVEQMRSGRPYRCRANVEGKGFSDEPDEPSTATSRPEEEIASATQSSTQSSQSSPSTSTEGTDLEQPNYVLWIGSLLTVIAVFYAGVFYAGAGLFAFVAEKADFKRKDFVPYSERMKSEQAAETSVVPPVLVEPGTAQEEASTLEEPRQD